MTDRHWNGQDQVLKNHILIQALTTLYIQVICSQHFMQMAMKLDGVKHAQIHLAVYLNNNKIGLSSQWL